ncbi:MAG: glycosyl hydrolase [Planctomycetota bacterium]
MASYAVAQPTFLPGEDPRPDGTAWKPVELLSDEFEADTVDLHKWQIEPKAGPWVWIGRPPGLFKADNVSIVDGKLSVTVGTLDEPVTVNGNEFTYQGGIVRAHHAGHVGWYYECKMKANATEMSSTFWLMTTRRRDEAAKIKKLELDIQECVGRITESTAPWAHNWDRIFHANAIHRKNEYKPEPERVQGAVETPTPNHEHFYVYGAWWKSPEEILFFLDGEHVFSLEPTIAWDVPAYLHMAIETYDWNPVPEDGGMVAAGNWEERTTQYEWVRTWKLEPAE